MDDGKRYDHTFVLRLWCEQLPTADCPAVWRFALTDARNRERHAFGKLDDLIAFLQAQMETEKKLPGRPAKG